MSDFGESKRIRGRKEHRCAGCWARIPKGEEHTHYSGVYGGEWQDWRMHQECYDAYAKDGYEEFVPGDFEIPQRIMALHFTKAPQSIAEKKQ